MRRGTQQRHIDGLFVLVGFGVFAVCILAVLLSGAASYRRLTARDAAAFDRRTAVQYIATKVRQADAVAHSGTRDVFVGNFDGTVWTVNQDGALTHSGDTLFLVTEYDGTPYYTRVYYGDGSVRELFTRADAAVSPEDGEAVLAARGLDFTLSGGLLTVTATAEDGAVTELCLALRSGGEATP